MQDIEITIDDGYLDIRAERQERKNTRTRAVTGPNSATGPSAGSILLPDGVKDEDIKASYTDGVLEVRTPLPETAPGTNATKKLPITRG